MALPAIEALSNQEVWMGNPKLTQEELDLGISRALHQVDLNLYQFGKELYPSPATYQNLYHSMLNTEWTNGFWTGMLWLAYEFTGDSKYADVAHENVKSYLDRVNNLIELNHHDLGFLYTPSCVAAYKLTGDELAKEAAIKAANQLLTRWRDKGQFIQAWGPMDSKDHYRLIIDCLLNVPLLYWASEVTGDSIYKDRAMAHFATTCENIIREDGSAFHTFYMDPETGAPSHGATRQGYSDTSAWARGQAWGIYGIPLNILAGGDAKYLDHWRAMRNFYLNRQPSDAVCMWDLIFNETDDQSRDSSAAAIAVCGLQASLGLDGLSDDEKNLSTSASNRILRSLITNYTGKYAEQHVGHPVLFHGVYSWHSGKGVDEGNIWGDYFFMEALARASKSWNPYW